MKDLTYKVKIRGIYSTALSHFLLKNEIALTQCSELIKERFEEPFSESDPDIIIEDSPDKRTLFISGRNDAILHILSLLREEFSSLIVRKSKIGKDAILKGSPRKTSQLR